MASKVQIPVELLDLVSSELQSVNSKIANSAQSTNNRVVRSYTDAKGKIKKEVVDVEKQVIASNKKMQRIMTTTTKTQIDATGKSVKTISRDVKDVENKVKKSTGVMSNSFGALATRVAQIRVLTGLWAFAVIAFTTSISAKLAMLASDAEEFGNRFDVVFGGVKGAREEFERLGDVLGRSTLDMINFGSEIGDVLKPLGFTAREAEDLSRKLVQLGIDVASFTNKKDVDVIRSFTRALTGERESLKTYGIAILEADVQQEAWREGIARTGTVLTKTEKALATYSLLLKNTVDAQGDAVRTQDSFANQLKRLQGNLSDLGVLLGNQILPTVNATVTGFNRFLEALEKGPGIVEAFNAILVVLQKEGFSKLFSPTLVKDIAKVVVETRELNSLLDELDDFIEKGPRKIAIDTGDLSKSEKIIRGLLSGEDIVKFGVGDLDKISTQVRDITGMQKEAQKIEADRAIEQVKANAIKEGDAEIQRQILAMQMESVDLEQQKLANMSLTTDDLDRQTAAYFEQIKAQKEMQKITRDVQDILATGFANAFADLLFSTESTKNKMEQLADTLKGMLADITAMVIKMAILKAIGFSVAGPAGAFLASGGVVGKAGGGVINMPGGGFVGAGTGIPGSFGRDNRLVALQNGEGVLTRQTTARLGGEAGINAMNNGSSPMGPSIGKIEVNIMRAPGEDFTDETMISRKLIPAITNVVEKKLADLPATRIHTRRV